MWAGVPATAIVNVRPPNVVPSGLVITRTRGLAVVASAIACW